MSSTYSLAPVEEVEAEESVDRLGAALAESPGWIGSFIILLNGLDFSRVPSMTSGGSFFEAATKHDSRGRDILKHLDDVYADVRDGTAATQVHGDILERFIWHSLADFPDRVGPCEIHSNGAACFTYRLDAATGTTPPTIGIEAKTSTAALKKRGTDRIKARAKATWVCTLHATTNSEIAGVWVSWATEERFRKTLRDLVGAQDADQALIVAHEQLRGLGERLRNLLRAMERAQTARSSD